MSAKLNDRDREWICEWIARGATNEDIAAAAGVGEASVRRFRKRHGLTAATSTRNIPVRKTLDHDVLEAEVRELRKAVRRNRREEVAEERVLRAIEQAVANTPHDPTPMPSPAPLPERAHHSQAALLSDWHIGEVVELDQMNGLNQYNYFFARQRVQEVHRSLLSFKSVRPELTELQLWFLGDMVSGNIHDELRETNEFPVAQQAVLTGHLIADLVKSLVPHYPAIRCIGLAGNHARTRKEHASKQVFDSMDVVAYELASALTPDSVTWEIPRSAMYVAEIAGRNILLWHGDGVRSSMPGVPWGGVMRRWNELRKSYAERDLRLDGLAVGHFHQANAVSGPIFMNGSLIGPNEYGLKNFGSGERPTQLLLTFDNDRRRLTDVSYITPSAGVPS